MLTCLLGAPTAWAEPGAEEVAVAQQLYQDARQHQENKQWASCEAALKRAIAILETPGLRFHLAFCKEQQHRWVEALVDYRRADELIAGGVAAEDVAALLPGAIANLEEQTPRLSLLMDDPPPDTQLYLDGKKVSRELLGTAIPVDPGLRRVEVAAPGYVPFTQAINLLAKDRRELRVALVAEREPSEVAAAAPGADEPTGAAVTAAPTEQSASGSSGSAKAVVLTAEAQLAVTALGIGVGFTLEGNSREQDRDDLLASIENPTACANADNEHWLCPDVRAADEDARSARDVAFVGYVAASVGAAAFLTTWLLWPDTDEAAASASGLRVAVSPGGGGIGYAGVF